MSRHESACCKSCLPSFGPAMEFERRSEGRTHKEAKGWAARRGRRRTEGRDGRLERNERTDEEEFVFITKHSSPRPCHPLRLRPLLLPVLKIAALVLSAVFPSFPDGRLPCPVVHVSSLLSALCDHLGRDTLRTQRRPSFPRLIACSLLSAERVHLAFFCHAPVYPSPLALACCCHSRYPDLQTPALAHPTYSQSSPPQRLRRPLCAPRRPSPR